MPEPTEPKGEHVHLPSTEPDWAPVHPDAGGPTPPLPGEKAEA